MQHAVPTEQQAQQWQQPSGQEQQAHEGLRTVGGLAAPIAVPVTGCYRGIFDSFKGERYHMVCRHRESNTPWGTVLDAWSRMPHKGMFAGCAAAGRSRRIKEWFK